MTEDYETFAAAGRWRRFLIGATLGLVLLLGFLAWFIPPVWRLDKGEISVDQWHKKVGKKTVVVGPDRPEWISSKAVSKHVLHATIVAEDARFYSHRGLDYKEIQKSFRLNLKKGRYARGASTITQQVVKMALLDREKTITRKAREAAGALLVESIISKRRILEWYINLAEYGDGVYGIKQAAAHYFKTKPERLTIQQAVHLALVLPSPNGWSVGLRRRNLTSFGHTRFTQILGRMRAAGYITEGLWLSALATGNFGRPVNTYNEVLAFLNKRDRNERNFQVDLDKFLKQLPGEESAATAKQPREAEENPPADISQPVKLEAEPTASGQTTVETSSDESTLTEPAQESTQTRATPERATRSEEKPVSTPSP